MNLKQIIMAAAVVAAIAACGLGISGAQGGVQNFALVDPNLNADLTVGGVCLPEAVLNVSSESLKRDSTLMIVFCSCDFSATETTAAGYLDTLCAKSHCVSDRHLHCTAEGRSLLELSTYILSNELCVEVGLSYLNNVEGNGHTNHLLKLCLVLFDLNAALTDNHTGLCAVNVDSYLGGVSLDFDLGNACSLQLLLQRVILWINVVDY
mgnify:CR=1 FL=1